MSLPLPPEPTWRGGERRCDRCQRPHRVLLVYTRFGSAWDLHFLEPDGTRFVSVGRQYDLPDDQRLIQVAERGGADLAHLRYTMEQWGRGVVWLQLAMEQYVRLKGCMQPG